MHTLRHHPLLRRLIGVVLLALLLAQGTALVHAIAHAPGQTVLAPGTTPDATATGTSHWGHPAGAPQCQVLEGLLVGQAPCAAPTALPSLDFRQRPLTAAVPLAPSLRTARSYQARAPPRG